MNATAINEVLEVPEVLNLEYEAKFREMDMEWLSTTRLLLRSFVTSGFTT